MRNFKPVIRKTLVLRKATFLQSSYFSITVKREIFALTGISWSSDIQVLFYAWGQKSR